MGADHVRVDFHSDDRVFGIKDEDRLFHVYVIGKTGTGKSTLTTEQSPVGSGEAF